MECGLLLETHPLSHVGYRVEFVRSIRQTVLAHTGVPQIWEGPLVVGG